MKTDLIPNRLEEYMTYFVNKNLVFIDSMQFMKSSLDKLAKNFSDDGFKYLTEEFGYKNLKLFRQKGAYPYEYMNSFERINEEKQPDIKCFYCSTKDRKSDYNGKKSDGDISFEDYLTCEKIQDVLDMKEVGDYHDHYLKKYVSLLAEVFKKFTDTCLKF